MFYFNITLYLLFLFSAHSCPAVVLTCWCICVRFCALNFPPAAVERNNLMRLSQSIPFTPVPPRGECGSRCIPRHVWSGENTAHSSEETTAGSWRMRKFGEMRRDVVCPLFSPSHTCSCWLISSLDVPVLPMVWPHYSGASLWGGAAGRNDLWQSGCLSQFYHSLVVVAVNVLKCKHSCVMWFRQFFLGISLWWLSGGWLYGIRAISASCIMGSNMAPVISMRIILKHHEAMFKLLSFDPQASVV